MALCLRFYYASEDWGRAIVVQIVDKTGGKYRIVTTSALPAPMLNRQCSCVPAGTSSTPARRRWTSASIKARIRYVRLRSRVTRGCWSMSSGPLRDLGLRRDR